MAVAFLPTILEGAAGAATMAVAVVVVVVVAALMRLGPVIAGMQVASANMATAVATRTARTR